MSFWSSLAAPFTRAAPMPLVVRSPRPRAGTHVVPDLPLWQQLQRIGGALTPMQVSAIIREADYGRMAQLVDLANEARQKDTHLQSVLATGEEAIAGLPWELALPDKPKLKERKATEWIESVLRETDSLSRFIAHHAGATFYGYAVSETLWAREDGRIVPGEFKAIAPRRFCFAPDTARLCLYDIGDTYPGLDFRAAYPHQFVVSQPRINGDIPCREGLVRVLMWAALFRNWTLSDWLKLGEIAWKPWRTATYKPEADADDINNLIGILEGMSSNGIAVYPDTTNLKIEWPGSMPSQARGMHADLYSTMAAEMSKCVLGQTLTTEQGKIGSQALGKVHNEVRKDLRESRASFVAADITRDVIAPMIALNFGPTLRVPRFRFLTDDAVDVAAFAAAIKTLRAAGTRIPAAWVRDQCGIPEPEDDEELLGDTQANEEAPPEPGPAADSADKPAADGAGDPIADAE